MSTLIAQLWPYIAAVALAVAAILGLTRRGRLNERGDVARDTADRVEKGRKAAQDVDPDPAVQKAKNDARWQ
jgi:hypothetical protein